MRPNLHTRQGRLSTFFLLYVTEGIPLGFAVTAVAYHLRRMGVGPAEIGAFVASFYLPWAFKWAFGPVVDLLRSARWGHRRAWILACQLLMAVTLAGLVAVPLPQGLALFTAVLLVHNLAAAVQDVAIDALACSTLKDDERGVGNGLMFAGAALGQALGGSGVLFLTPSIGFQSSFFLVAGAILLVTALVVWPLREPVAAAPALAWRAAFGQVRFFAEQAFAAFLATRGAWAGVLFSLLPAGAMGLGLALRSTLSAEFGLPEQETAQLELWSNVVAAIGMVGGGWLSDRWGRRRTLAVYLALMSLPTAWLAWRLQALGYSLPQAPGGPRDVALASLLWTASLVYNGVFGMMYGTRSAIMMDVTRPQVAGTQFTAYMALMNVAIALSATWQGVAVEAWGYPTTLALDAGLGLLTLLVLPCLRPGEADGRAPGRARALSAGLAVACGALAVVLVTPVSEGPWKGVVNPISVLITVGAALVVAMGAPAGTRTAARRAMLGVAVALVLLHARRWMDPGLVRDGLTVMILGAGAVTLGWLARQPWAATTLQVPSSGGHDSPDAASTADGRRPAAVPGAH